MSPAFAPQPFVDRDQLDPQELKRRFTDRNPLKAAFAEILTAAPPLPVVMFYGLGGVGKSYLLSYLRYEHGCRWQEPPQGGPHAFLSFRTGHTPTGASEALFEARKQLQRYLRRHSFVRFDLLWAKHWERCHHMKLAANGPLASDELAWLAGLLEAVDIVPFAGQAVAFGNIVARHVREAWNNSKVGSWFLEQMPTCRQMKWKDALDQAPVGQLEHLLPQAFAADLSDITAGNQGGPVLIFVDNYETLQQQVGELDGMGNRSFVQVMAEELIVKKATALLAIAGRDRLRWGERPSDKGWELNTLSPWASAVEQCRPDAFLSRHLRQYLVGSLSETDSLDYLRNQRSQNEENANRIYAVTRGYPLAMDIAVHLLRAGGPRGTDELEALRAKTLSYEPLSEPWTLELSRWLLERLLEHLEPQQRGVTKIAAVPRWFVKQLLFNLAGRLGDDKSLDKLVGYFFVESFEIERRTAYRLHAVVRELLRQQGQGEDSFDALAIGEWDGRAKAWFDEQVIRGKGAWALVCRLEALYHHWQYDPQAAAVQTESWFRELYPSQSGLCRQVLDTAEEVKRRLPPELLLRLQLLESKLHQVAYAPRDLPAAHKQRSLAAAEQALALLDKIDDPAQRKQLEAKVCLAVAAARNSLQQFEESLQITRRACEAAERVGDRLTLAEGLRLRAGLATRANPEFGKLELLEQAAGIYREAGDQKSLIGTLYTKAYLAARGERFSETEAALREAEQINQTLEDKSWACNIFQIWGEYYLQVGRYAEAADALRRACDISRELNLVLPLCAAEGFLGMALCHLGHDVEGMPLVQRALTVECDVLDSREGAAKWFHLLGQLLLARGESFRALQTFWLAESLREELAHVKLSDTRRAIAEVRECLGEEAYERCRVDFEPRRSEFAEHAFLWGPGVFRKHCNNPILAPRGDGWESRAVFNPAAWTDGRQVYLLYRAEGPSPFSGRDFTSRIGLAVSNNGVHFDRRVSPVLEPSEPYEVPGGCEDPRLVHIDGMFYLTYTAYDGRTARLAMAVSHDLEHWTKLGPVFTDEQIARLHVAENAPSAAPPGWCKSGALLDRKIGDHYWMYFGDTNIWCAYSSDLRDWTIVEEPVLRPRTDYFDSQLVESGPPPQCLSEGIWLGYNSAAKDRGYAFGGALFAADSPCRLLRRSSRPLLVPTTDAEVGGQVPRVVFGEGLVSWNGQWLLYYGMADSRIGLAVAVAPNVQEQP